MTVTIITTIIGVIPTCVLIGVTIYFHRKEMSQWSVQFEIKQIKGAKFRLTNIGNKTAYDVTLNSKESATAAYSEKMFNDIYFPQHCNIASKQSVYLRLPNMLDTFTGNSRIPYLYIDYYEISNFLRRKKSKNNRVLIMEL